MTGEAEGPGANVATLPRALVERRLDALLTSLGPISPDACCAGAAGAEVPDRRERLATLLRRRFPGSRVEVVHDARLVLAAAGLDEGVVLISGTGSVAYARSAEGYEAQAGGWGWMLGDVGSGTWIVREAAREVMHRADAGIALGALGEAMLAATRTHGAKELTAKLHSMREPMKWAALAPRVFDAAEQDEGARSVIEAAANELWSLAQSVREAVHVDGPIVVAGGVLLHQPLLEARLRKLGGDSYIRLEEPPVAGAVRLAEGLILA